MTKRKKFAIDLNETFPHLPDAPIADAEHNVGPVRPNGVAFSRVKHDDRWEALEAEVMRFWKVFLSLAAPPRIERLGVRFINQILLGKANAASYLKRLPTLPEGMGVSFLPSRLTNSWHGSRDRVDSSERRTIQSSQSCSCLILAPNAP